MYVGIKIQYIALCTFEQSCIFYCFVYFTHPSPRAALSRPLKAAQNGGTVPPTGSTRRTQWGPAASGPDGMDKAWRCVLHSKTEHRRGTR